MSQTTRSLLLALALALTAAPAADAVPLTVTSKLELQVTPDGPVDIAGPGTAQHRLPGEHATPGGSGAVWRGVATAETGIDPQPFASTRAESFSTLAVTQGGTRVNAPGESFAFAELEYQVVLTSIVPPPVPLLLVPAKVQARGSARTEVVGDSLNNFANALVTVRVAGFGMIDISLFDTAELTEQQTVEFLFEPGQLIDVVIRTLVRVWSGGTTSGPLETSAVGTAFGDPDFFLDQAAFDEMARQQGFAPFDLSQYFRFDEPGTVVAAVPSPAPWMLVLAATLGPAAGVAARAVHRRMARCSVLEVGRPAG